MSLEDFRISIDKWCIRREKEYNVYVEQSSDEVVVSEDSVARGEKVKIVNRDSGDSLPQNKVRVRKLRKINESSSDYSYEAVIIDDEIQQDPKKAQQDANERNKISDPFSKRRREKMSDISRL